MNLTKMKPPEPDAAFEISAHDNSTQPETIAFADTYADTYRGIVSFFGFSA